ncbi:CoA-binding protein [Candidatus Sumerlaeota bacterium]|nr:CoA-binding protein [Candidatus Sumerlaeota bacterium]
MDLIAKTAKMKTWAVVGAHDDPSRFGHRIFRHLLNLGYTVYPIHPRLKEIDGHQVFKAIGDLPVVPEVVDMVVNPETGIKVMAQIKAFGVKYVWMQPGTRSEEIREFAKREGIQLIEDCVLVQLH